jgi:hypothetical protein
MSDGWSDAEVVRHMETARPLPDAVFTIGSNDRIRGHVYELCPDTVVKKNLPLSLAYVLKPAC